MQFNTTPKLPGQVHGSFETAPGKPLHTVVEVEGEEVSGVSGVGEILTKGPMEQVELSPLGQGRVKKEPLQESVNKTKTRERLLVFNTLKQKSKKIFENYSKKDLFEKRLKQEIVRYILSNSRLSREAKLSTKEDKALDEFIKSLNLPDNPKNVDKEKLRERLEGFGIKTHREIADKVCFVGKRHVSSDMKIFKRILFNEVVKAKRSNGETLEKGQLKEIEKQIKKLDLGKNPQSLSVQDLKNTLSENRILTKTLASEVTEHMCQQMKIDQTPRLKSDLNHIDTFKNKLFHTIMNQRAKEGYKVGKKEANALRKQIDQLEIGTEPKNVSQKKLAQQLYDKGITRKKLSIEIATSVCKEYNSALKNSNREIEKLSGAATKLNTLLGGNPEDKDLQQVNLEVISLLREAFNSKAYQALKECEDNPTISYLHEINLAMYTEVNLLDAYVSGSKDEKYLGDKLLEGHESKKLGDAIQEVRDDAVKNRGLFSSHACIEYIFNHFQQFWGALISQKIGSVFGTYDPHGELGNNAGALYQETLNVNGKKGKALDVRTPSPTVGDKVSHEFRAALQAIQNQRMAEYAGEEGYGRPNTWLYTNYQDMTNKMNGEYGRSKAIMQLNDEFPLAFSGITLSKDSAYFKDGIGHGEGESLWKNIYTSTVFNSDSVGGFIDEMKTKLKDDAHFTLANRSEKKGNKLYFPAKSPQEIKEYKAALDIIADQTGLLLQKIVGGNDYKGKEAWKIKAAAKEFAYAAIQKYIQAKELAKLEEQGLAPSVITTSACKEDIDRGFSDHVKRMYMLGAGDEALLAKIVNLPALMARYRVILNDRVQPLIGVATYVDRDKAKEHLNVLSDKYLGVSSISATPLIKT